MVLISRLQTPQNNPTAAAPSSVSAHELLQMLQYKVSRRIAPLQYEASKVCCTKNQSTKSPKFQVITTNGFQVMEVGRWEHPLDELFLVSAKNLEASHLFGTKCLDTLHLYLLCEVSRLFIS